MCELGERGCVVRHRMGETWSEAVRLTWRWWEAMRRLGFTADQLFVVVAANAGLGGVLTSFVKLRHCGAVFKVGAARTPDPDAFAAEWDRFGRAIVAGEVPEATLRSWWDAGERIDAVGLGVALLAKGIRPPGRST